MKYRALVGVGAICALSTVAVAGDAGHLAGYVKALNSAQGLDVSYTVIEVGGAPGEFHVVLSKSGKAMIDTPLKLYVADGTNLTTLDKSRNTFFVQVQTAGTIQGLLAEEQLSLWRPFFDPKAFDDVASTRNEGIRKRRGETLKTVSAQIDAYGEYTIRLHLGQRDNLVRQAELLSTKGPTPKTLILTVSSMNTGTPASELFAFVAPANARLLSEIDLRAEAIASLVIYAQSEGEAGKSTYKPVQPENMDLAAGFYKAVIDEFSKYPRDFMEASNLKKIVLVEQLYEGTRDRPGLPRASEETLYYDVSRFKNQTYARDLIHHEFYHMLEEQWNGSQFYKDPKWAAFNPSDFKYGSGGADAIRGPDGKNLWPLNHPQPGFASKYATSGLEEDKAVIWGSMFVRERWTLLKKLVAVDPIISAKVQYLREFARSRSPEMEGEYWEIVVAKEEGS